MAEIKKKKSIDFRLERLGLTLEEFNQLDRPREITINWETTYKCKDLK